MRSAQAHVHGAWTLFAALDGKTLTVTFAGPLADLAGVEHRSGSPEEEQALEAARAELAGLEPLATLSEKARCGPSAPLELTLVQTADSQDDQEGHEDHKDHDDHDDHGDDGDHGDHEDHEDHEDHHEGHEDAHGSDVELTYAFACDAPGRLKAIKVDAFNVVEGIETIDAVFLGDARQVAARLTPSAAVLPLD